MLTYEVWVGDDEPYLRTHRALDAHRCFESLSLDLPLEAEPPEPEQGMFVLELERENDEIRRVLYARGNAEGLYLQLGRLLAK